MNQLMIKFMADLQAGLVVTLGASIITLIFSLLFGTLLAIGQLSKYSWLRKLATIYVEFFKNIPLLVVAMFFFIVVPLYFIPINGFTAGVLGLILYTTAFIAETIRTGLVSIPKGQKEAGQSTGLRESEIMREIILPQAFRVVLPALGNQFVDLIKNSSILAVVAAGDLMYHGDLIASNTFQTLDTYLLIGLMYLSLTLPLSYLMRYLEMRLAWGYQPKRFSLKLSQLEWRKKSSRKELINNETVRSLHLD